MRRHCFQTLFPWLAKLGNISGAKFASVKQNVFDLIQKHFLASKTQNLLPQHVSHTAKLGNICVCGNIFATMFPSLARPLGGNKEIANPQNERSKEECLDVAPLCFCRDGFRGGVEGVAPLIDHKN